MTIIQHASFSANDVQIEQTQSLYQGFLKVERVALSHRAFQSPQWVHVQRELLHRPAAAGALLYNDQQQRFALIEQFRVGALRDPHSPWQLEIVAGVLDGDELPEQCIRRECLEEAGCEVETLTHLFGFYPSAGACSEYFDLYAA
ncbi:MAG: NUDIX domain-containing protein, partial [Acinetobacter sp.]|nr:NUDIX domain-containing protein [Acinetobacter sp.]